MGDNQRHTGIVFRIDADESHEFLHLAWHFDLRRDQFDARYFWVQPALPQRRLLQVAVICDRIATANDNGIPYSFGPPNDCFDEKTCEFLLGPTTTGLTCASFVLAVFHRAGLPLVRYSSWPRPTQEDIDWQNVVVENLRHGWQQGNPAVSQEHINHVANNEVGSSVRYRPEHVAAAALKRRWRPVRYSKAARVGRMILAYIRGEDPPPSEWWWEQAWRWFLRKIG